MATATKKKAAKRKAGEQQEVELEVGGIACRIDSESLDYGEVFEIERFFERPIGELREEDWNGMRGTFVLGFLARRRVDPTFTREQAERLKPGDIKVTGTRPIEIPDEPGESS